MYNHADNVVMVKSQGDKIVIICHSEEQLDQINERFMKRDANVILVDYEEWDEDDDMGYGENKNLKTNLPYLLHNADSLATRWEKEQYMFSKDSDINYSEILHPELKVERVKQEEESVENIKEAITKNETPDILSQKSKDLFDELFGDK